MLEHWPGPVRRGLFKLVGVDWADRLLNRAWRAGNGQLHGMLDWMFQRNAFELDIENAELLDDLDSCIVAGNHPHGLFDGLALAWLASRSGLKTRVVARHFLNVFEPLQRVFLSVRLDGQRRSRAGRAPLNAAEKLLDEGGRLVITPAGGISVAQPFWSQARDPQWRTGVVRLARNSGKPIVLVDVQMANSPTRQLLHRIHPIVRALFQVWAYRLGKRQRIRLKVVAVVQPDELPEDKPLPAQALWLQQRHQPAQLPLDPN